MPAAVGCGGGGDGDAVSPAAERAHQLLAETGLHGVESGYFDSNFFVDNETKAVAVQWGAEGPFALSGDALQTNARLEDAGLDGVRLGTLLVHGDQTFLGLDGKSYRLPAPLSDQSSEASSNCQKSLEEIDPGTLVKNLEIKREPVGETTVVGDLRLPAVLAAVDRLTDPAVCGSLLEATGLSPQARGALEAQVEKTFKKSEATFTFNKDHVLTQVTLGIWVESPPPKPEEIDGILTVSLSDLNEAGRFGGSPSSKAFYARAGEASPAQRSAVEGWVGLVDAVFGSLAGS